MDALLKRALEIAQTRGDSVLLDVGLACLLRQIGNFERCSYEIAKTLAEVLDRSSEAKVLESHARDEAVIEQTCTVLSEDMIDSLQLELARKSSSASGLAGEAPLQ